MKVGTVQISTVASTSSKPLTASTYLDPTRHVDHRIATLEKTISKANAELRNLRRARKELLKNKPVDLK